MFLTQKTNFAFRGPIKYLSAPPQLGRSSDAKRTIFQVHYFLTPLLVSTISISRKIMKHFKILGYPRNASKIDLSVSPK